MLQVLRWAFHFEPECAKTLCRAVHVDTAVFDDLHRRTRTTFFDSDRTPGQWDAHRERADQNLHGLRAFDVEIVVILNIIVGR